MDFRSARALVVDTNFEIFGVDATVTVIGCEPVRARAIWLTESNDLLPAGASLQRRDAVPAVAFRRSEIAEVPRGACIVMPAPGETACSSWVVESRLASEAEHVRVVVRRLSDETM